MDSYEGEVGVLETSLSKLRAHRWGVGADAEALLDALSMDRGQQTIDPQKRKELISSILHQQREQVRNVMECQMENMVLGWIANYHPSHHNRQQPQQQQQPQDDDKTMSGADAGGGTPNDANTNNTNTTMIKKEADDVMDEKQEDDTQLESLAMELNEMLQLTPSQKEQLRKTTEGIEEERQAIETVDACLTAMMSNSWLMNHGVEECTEQFTSILNSSQMSKFLLWADHNSEAIDTLDYVNAPPASAPPAQGPVFVFGMDDGPQNDEGEESKY